MKKLIFLIFFSFLFATGCNKSSINSAYKDYYKYQQKYISAILDDNRKDQVIALTGLIECGNFLHLDTKEYSRKLKTLKHQTILKPALNFKKSNVKTPHTKYKKISKYIKIYSYNPLKIRIPDINIKYFTINKKPYKKVIDLPNAILPKFIKKSFPEYSLKIAQFNKKTVRIVFYSYHKFNIRYKISHHILTVYCPFGRHTRKKTALINLAQKPKAFKRKNKIIVIDPGHGGKDAGGIGIDHRMEKIAVLQIAKYLKKDLQKRGFTVYLTRKGDYFIPLKQRTHFANLKKADLFISIHCNIAPHHLKYIHGIETYFLSPTRSERAIRVARIENKEVKGLNYLDQRVILNFLNRDRIIESNKFAIDVQRGMLSSLRAKYSHVKDNGVRPAPFWVLVGTQMPAILIETGYLTNPMESARLFNPSYQKRLADGIARGVVNYFRKNP